MPAGSSSRPDSASLLSGSAPRRDGVLAEVRDSVRLAGRRRHGGARPRPRRRGGHLRRPDPDIRGGVERRGVPLAPRSGRAALPGEGSRLRGDRPAHAQRRGHDRVPDPVADDAVVRRGGAGHRRPADRRRAGERRRPALPADGEHLAGDHARQRGAARPVGQDAGAGGRLRRHQLDGLHGCGGPGAGHRRLHRRSRRPRRRRHAHRIGGRRRTPGARLGSRPRRPRGARIGGVRCAQSCTAPATAWARRFTAMAPISTTTRPRTNAG